jgi:hypothetical protein
LGTKVEMPGEKNAVRKDNKNKNNNNNINNDTNF